MIRSIPNTWEHIKLEDIAHHLKLEEKNFEATRTSSEVYGKKGKHAGKTKEFRF